MATETLPEILDISVSSERAQSPTLIPNPTDDGLGSGSEPLGSAIQAQENGVRVVKVEISVEKNFGCPNGDGFLGDVKVTGGLSKSEHGGESPVVKDLAEGDSVMVIGDGSDGKEVEFDHNGISLVVEVHGSLDFVNGNGKNCEHEDEECENGGDPGEKFRKIPGSVSRIGKRGYVRAVGRRKYGADRSGGENGDDDDDDGEEDEDVGEDGGGDEEHDYVVGDFVWGKIRSHPWWPGQIYDPSDASEYARKYNQRERLLVAYFGDGSFSWCSPSQLKPFAEDFEEMSKQSNSKNFANAVQKALDELVRLVELKMTCSCVPEENWIGLARPLAMNAGIKQGVLVPDCDLSRLSVPQNGPVELLSTLRYIAEVVSVSSVLELTVLRSWLSAFYRAKGGHKLSMYHEPLYVEGLEEKNRNVATDINDFSGLVEVPFQGPSEEDWISSPVQAGFGQANQSLLQKCPGISEDKLYYRRKKKSIAELMKEDMVAKTNNKKGSTVKDVTSPGKLVSTSGKKKRKSSDEAPSKVGSDFTSPSGRTRRRMKRVEALGSPKYAEKKVSSAKNGGGGGEEKPKKKDNVSSVEDGGSYAREETEMASPTRERKMSKYLSPPFTNLMWSVRNSSFKRDLEAESVKIAKVARIGERMTRASSQLIGSPPIVNCSDETFKEKPCKELDTKADTSAMASPRPPREDKKKIIDSIEINASTKEVVCEVRSAALNPLYLRQKNSVDMIKEFISAFKSAVYLNGPNYKMYHRNRTGRKRKLLSSEPGLLGKDLNQTDHEIPESKSPQKRNRKNEQAKSAMPKVKQAGRASGTKTIDKETNHEASTPVSLIVTFPPGFSLPLKNDLLTVFSKFGTLNEKETDVLYNSYCARVVFVKNSDAEKAFESSLKKSPFGPAKVNYRLRYPSAASRACEGNEKPSSPPAASKPYAVDEASRLLFIKQKLEMMTSMLEKSDGNMLPELKSNLQGEMKGLLEKVSTMASSSSS